MLKQDNSIERITTDIDRDSQEIQDFLVQMLRINAVNPRLGGPGEQERADFIESFLKKEGFSTTRIDVKDDEFAKKRPNIMTRLGEKGMKTLWFISHMDTVPEGSIELWHSDPFEPAVKEGKIIARGAEDNGQALVSSLFALRELKRLDAKVPFGVGVCLVSDEEVRNTYGIKSLLERGNFRNDDLVIVPDAGTPKGDEIELAEKGLLWLKITTQGKQVHASQPSKGLNARRIGAKLAVEIDESLAKKFALEDPLFREPSSTFEPTKVEPNVPNLNTIPGLDVIYFDCRVLPTYDLKEVVSHVGEIVKDYERRYGGHISLEVLQMGVAGPPTAQTSEVAVLLSKSVHEMTWVQPRFVGIGGRTIANLFRERGIAAAVWSTVDNVPHEPNEYSRISSLISDTKVFAAIPIFSRAGA